MPKKIVRFSGPELTLSPGVLSCRRFGFVGVFVADIHHVVGAMQGGWSSSGARKRWRQRIDGDGQVALLPEQFW
jgi:hypothetical protein